MSLVEEIWWSDRPRPAARALGAALRAPEALFRAGAALRGALYGSGLLPAFRAPVPVVSVGNVAVGGAGKTPATAAIAERLRARRRRVAILSRGYGAARRDPRLVADREKVRLGAADAGDEPYLLATRLPGTPVLCGPQRVPLARWAVEELAAQVLLLDDGFQHRALARDLDVVLLDAANPFGNGRLLPAGPNREPRSELRRAGLVWLSRVDQAAGEAALEPLRRLAREWTGRPPVESRHAPEAVLDGALERAEGIDALRGARVLLLSGLARPGSFRRTVEAMGATVAAERRYPDHHRFTPAEVREALEASERAGCARVVTTEKDAVRLPPAEARDPRLRVVRITAEIVRGAESLDAALDAALASGPERRR